MSKRVFCLAIAAMLCLTVSFAHAQRGGKEGGKPGGKEGAKPGGKEGAKQGGKEGKEGNKQGNREGGKEGSNAGHGAPAGKAPGGNWSDSKQHPQSGHNEAGAAGAAANNRNEPNNAGAKGAAAGAATANRNEPRNSGANGAAAGAAVANRNEPKTSGAEGAAAGAAVANRNEPKTTGAEGAAAGAAVANRNAPKTSGAEGAAVGAAAANRREPNGAGAEGAAAGYAAVRNSFDRPELYGQAWHESNPNVWAGASWTAGTAWTASAWSDVAGHLGYGNNTPLSFDYGNNVTCVNGNIVQDGQEIGTAEEFSQQASELAQAGADAKTSPSEKWLPLGIFAMVQNEQQHPHLVLQLAVDEAGNLRGNYTDTVTDNTQPIQGGVDPKTQRAAWTVGTNVNSVLEAGLSNLTEGHAPALLHKNGKTERWILVRLPKPE